MSRFTSTGDLLDQLILGNPPGSLLVPLCAKEVLVLRILGSRWQTLSKSVVAAHSELMAHPTGFGAVDTKMYLTRKYSQDNVIMGTQVHEIELSPELFVWPLPK